VPVLSVVYWEEEKKERKKKEKDGGRLTGLFSRFHGAYLQPPS